MSGIVVVYNRDGAPVGPEILEAMCAAVQEHAWHGQHTVILDPVGFAHQHLWVTPEEVGEEQPIVDDASGLMITADARIDNRDALFRKLQLDHRKTSEISDAQLILNAYQRWGDACTDHLLGDFAFVIWDAHRRRLFAARDAMGARGLVYWESDRLVCFATDISHLLAHPAIPVVLNEARIADLLLGRYSNSASSYYSGIRHVPPAHRVVADETGLRLEQYWDFDPSIKIRYKNDEEYAEHFRQLLTEAVRCRLRSTGPAALSLSGGLDSTTLAAVLAGSRLPEANNGRLKTYSYVFDDFSECDERQYVQQTVDRFDLEATYINCDKEWTLRDIETWPMLRDFLTTDPYPRLPIGIATKAGNDGVRVLFSGVFGDSLFEGSRFWLVDLLRTGQFGRAADIIAQNKHAFSWKRTLFNNGAYRVIPKPARSLARHRLAPGMNAPVYMDAEFAAKHMGGAGENTTANNQNNGDEFFHSRRRGLQLSIFSQGLAATRRYYAGRGIELQCPYRDRQLAEFIMAIPANQLGFPAHDRYIVRESMRGRIPDSVIDRVKRTVFVSLMDKGLLEMERDTVRQLLDSPEVIKRGYFSSEWLKSLELTTNLRNRDVAMLWKCLSVELWIRKYW